MAKIQFLTILLGVTCFLGSVVSATDKEIEVCSVHVRVVMLKMCVFLHGQIILVNDGSNVTDIIFCSSDAFLVPTTKLGQGYIFTGICDSIHRGGGIPACLAGSRPTPKGEV